MDSVRRLARAGTLDETGWVRCKVWPLKLDLRLVLACFSSYVVFGRHDFVEKSSFHLRLRRIFVF